MKLPLTPSDTHVIKLLALSEGLDPQDDKAIGEFVAQLCKIELDRRLAVMRTNGLGNGGHTVEGMA